MEVQKFNASELVQKEIKASQRIIHNYLKNFSSYHNDNRDIALTYLNFFTKIATNPAELFRVGNFYLDFFQAQQKLLQRAFLNQSPGDLKPIIVPQKDDRRFSAKEWSEYSCFDLIKQNYLLFEKLVKKIIEDVEIKGKTRKKIEFYSEQYLNFLAPTNFVATNPELLKMTIASGGKNLWNGFYNLLADIDKGRITQTDETAFALGKTLAATPGHVIFENELIQLIQYTPATKEIYEIPLLIIPPWINKYYIVDLQEKNSLVQFLVKQGISVYVVSWRNPKPRMGYLTFDDYVEKGALKAIEVVHTVSASKKINTLGYCLGGTLLSIAGSILSGRKNEVPINTATFLGSMVDFSDSGPMGDVIDVALVKKLEREELHHDGVLHGHDMERAFNLIRANDLIWKYVIDNYLKGLPPSAFDVMYWTNDNTNLPRNMYLYYMGNMILANKLSRKNALRICDQLIDVGKIEFPVFVIGMKEDYISPAKTCFVTTELVSGPVEFILGGSGHVMGAINPPAKNKYGYFLNGTLGNGFDKWQKTATFFEGSWWTPWSERLKNNSGKQIEAPTVPGKGQYKSIEPAPGSYVKERC